jgi:hypothetical protein
MPTIEDYGFGHVIIGRGGTHPRRIVLTGRLVRNWRRKGGHGLVLEDLADMLDELPQCL